MAEGKHILVTGGAGFIGSHLVDRLLGEGEQVAVIDNCSTGTPENLNHAKHNPRLQFYQTKVSTCAELERIVSKAKEIYHLAAAVGVDLVLRQPIQTIQTNLRETEVILEAASHYQVPVLLTSTSEVYGKSQKAAFSEEDDLVIGPSHLSRWSYACSKLMDEFLALAYWKDRGLPVVIARVFNTVGPRQTGRYGMVLPRFIAAAKAGKPLQVYGDGQQTRCFCYVADTVEALARLMSTPEARGEVFNVGNDEEITIEGLAALVVKTVGSSSPIQFVPQDTLYDGGLEDLRRRKPVLSKLAKVCRFRPERSLATTIQQTAAE